MSERLRELIRLRSIPPWSALSTRDRVLRVGAIVGFAFLATGLVVIARDHGGLGYDTYAYWLAGRHVLEGQPLYWQNAVDAFGAYRYPPLFAQLWSPFALFPPLVLAWTWRLVCFLSLRWLAGSWRNVGLWCLVPFTITELSIANVTLPMAAMSVMALQGRAWMAAWAGALKFGPLLLLPYLWLARPASHRSVSIGVATVALAVGISFAFDPASWRLYVQSLTWLSSSDMQGFGIVSLLPNGFVDVGLRLLAGVVLVALAIWRGSDRMAFAASIVAVPVLAIWRLVPLLVLPRLAPARRVPSAERAKVPSPATGPQIVRSQTGSPP